MIGVKLRTNVCNTNIHLPFCEVGENLQRPFEISWIEEEEAEKVLVPKIPEEESERKLIIRFFYIFWFQTQWPFIFTDEAHKVNAWRDFWSKISPKSLPELMPSPFAFSKFGLSILNFFKHAQFFMYTQNHLGILKS